MESAERTKDRLEWTRTVDEVLYKCNIWILDSARLIPLSAQHGPIVPYPGIYRVLHCCCPTALIQVKF